MKANKILLTALASAALVGCADDFAGVDNNGISQDLNGKLVEAGLFSVDRNETADSRALNPLGGFVWMPSSLEGNGAIKGDSNQKVGFCWTGRNNESANFGAVATVGKNVYTNYKYEHVGWLDKDATVPQILDCTVNELANGAYIESEGTPEASFQNTWGLGQEGRWNGYYTSAKTGAYTATSHRESTGTLDLGRGVFSTENASVFEGEYLVYYPYTDEFTKGEIIATLPREYNINTSSDAFAAASESAFALGYVDHYKGGDSSSGLAAKTLNGYAVVRLYNYNAQTTPADKNISKVIIYSKSGDLLYSQSLDASACVDALAKGNKLGTNVYGTLKSEKTNSVVAKLGDGTNAYTTIKGKNSAPTEANKYTDYVYVAIPMLPQTIAQNFEIVLVDEDEKTCRISEAPATFTSNGAVYFDYNVATLTFKNEYMATDEASLYAAWKKINQQGESDLNIVNANVINILNNINLQKLGEISGTENHHAWTFNKNITITSECAVTPTLTLDSEQGMIIRSTYDGGSEDVHPTLTFNVPVVVAGAGCCGEKPASLILGGSQNKAYHMIFNKNVTNNGALVVNNDVSDAYKLVEFNAVLENAYDDYAVEQQKTEGAAELYLLGTKSLIDIATLNNKGDVKSVANSANLTNFYRDWTIELDAALTTPVDTRTVNTTIGTLNNEGTVEIKQYTLVNVNDVLDNKIAAAVIKTVGTGHSTIDGRLDVKGTSANKGAIDNTGVINFTASSLDNDGLFIDRQNGQVGGLYVDNGTATGTTTKVYGDVTYKTDLGKAGIYVAQVATTERMGVVLSDEVVEPSTVIVEIIGSDVTGGVYNLEKYGKTLNVKDVYVNSPSQAIMFKSFKYDETEGDNVPTETVFGHCVTVLNGSTLTVTEGTLSTVAEVNVNNGGKFISRAGVGSNVDMDVNVTVGTNLNNAGTVEHTADLLTVSGNLSNSGAFGSKNSFAVGGNVTTSGTFDVDGTPNTVTGNFTQTDGTVTFATQTITTINGTFACTDGTFEREGLNGGNTHRATVNVKTLGATSGSTSTAWPTVKK